MNSERSAQSAHRVQGPMKEIEKKNINLKMYFNIHVYTKPGSKSQCAHFSEYEIITNDMQSQLNVPFSYTNPFFFIPPGFGSLFLIILLSALFLNEFLF